MCDLLGTFPRGAVRISVGTPFPRWVASAKRPHIFGRGGEVDGLPLRQVHLALDLLVQASTAFSPGVLQLRRHLSWFHLMGPYFERGGVKLHMCALGPPPYTFQYQAKYSSPWTCFNQQERRRLLGFPTFRR